jgi:hypothetical protein
VVAIGDLAMSALFVPFTLAHDPTSYNEASQPSTQTVALRSGQWAA